jgi:ribosome-binding ATPase
MRIALVGQPGCGRTTLFRALAGNPSADPGKPLTVPVPDPRLDLLYDIWKPRKKVPATVVFTDTPSPAFSPRMLGEMHDAAAIALVIDNFAKGSTAADFALCEADLMISDLSVIEKRLERLVKESKARSQEFHALEAARSVLEAGGPLRAAGLDPDTRTLLSPYAPLSLKPLFAISNRSSAPVGDEEKLKACCESAGAGFLAVDASFELELSEIPEDERSDFLSSMGYESSGLSRLLSMAYSSLDLISFLTMGPDEVRAWPVPRGSTAVEAAAAIHTDLARGFIRAQVTAFDDYAANPDPAGLRDRGAFRLEGRDYIVRDGDILEIRFSV